MCLGQERIDSRANGSANCFGQIHKFSLLRSARGENAKHAVLIFKARSFRWSR
jgi:hypothetical protein